MTWRRCLVLVRGLAADPSSLTHRRLAGDEDAWGLQEQLLAVIADTLAAANWQRGGNRNAPRPKPIPRPGVKDDRKRRRGEVLPVEEVKRRHAKYRPVEA